MLKDETKTLPKTLAPFSLSRTLLFYWTVIIILSYCFIGIIDDNASVISPAVLILMGIMAGTTTTGKLIDTDQIQNPSIVNRIQDMPSEGFLNDILSDGNGVSISRLQIVAFNIIFGLIFIGYVVSQHVLYNFPATTLTLLGISSGAYALLKIPENK